MTTKTALSLSIALLGLATTLPSRAVEIDISDISLTPDSTNATQVLQTDISIPNGGNVLPNVNGTVVYAVTTYTFGAGSESHFISRFNAINGATRLGIEVQDTGLIQFASTNDPGRTNVNLAQDMAGTTVTLLIKQHYDTSNDSLRATLGTSDDTLMTVWVNPDNSDVEGSGLTAGDMHTLWNSATYKFFTQTIENQSTPGTAGNSFITNTVILTGADATFANANALALATGATPPTGIVDSGISTVSASPSAVPANGTSISTVTVTLKDASGNPVAGKEVSLAGGSSAVIATGDNTSNAGGEVTFTAKSSSIGLEQFTATDVTDGNLVITQTASVDFQEVVVVGPVNAANSTVAASSAIVPANGIATSTITVALKDSNGALTVGEDVTLAGSPAGTTISPAATQTTNVNGQANFRVSSSVIDTVAFTATSVTDSVTVTQTANVEFADPATATAYNVNFHNGTDATGLLGVVGDPGETWNQGTTSVSNLLDSTGTGNSSVSVSGLANGGATVNTPLSVFNANRNFFGKGSDTTVSLLGLVPDTAYDLHIYALSHNTSSWGDITSTERAAGDFVTSNTVLGNGQSQFLDNGFAGTNGSAFKPNANYVVFQSIVSDGSGNISVVVDAYDGADGNSSTNDGDCRLHVSGMQIRPASGISVDYGAWRGSSYPGLGLPDEDDDNDGLSNDYERIFGLDPTDSASLSPYRSDFDPNTGDFSYSRRTKSLINMNYKVWYSTDIVAWFEDNAANQTPGLTADDVEVVGVRIDRLLLSKPKLFLQVRATPLSGVDPEPSLVNLLGSGNTITLLFSEPMDPSAAANPLNYTVTQDGVGTLSISGATLSSDGTGATLTLASTLGIATGYTVDIAGVTSGTGQSLGSGVSRQFTTWDNDPTGIKVFILAGQSNMVGFGNVEDGATGAGTIGSLRYLAANNDNTEYDYFDFTSLLVGPNDTASAFANRSDVKVWWRNGGNGNLGGPIGKGDLGPPYQGRDSGKIGPEFGFGQIIGNYYASDDVLIIKCAWGGRDLAEKFRGPSAVSKRGGQVGEFYSATINQTREVLNNLGTEFPEWSGRGYEIVGFAWHQGFNDRINPSFSAEYKDNLPDLIDDVREVFNKPNLPFVVASTGMETGPAEAAPYPGYSAVEKAQLWVAGVAKPANVLSTDTRPFARAAADSPVPNGSQGFHWNHNAESQFLIGKALGENMVGLLGSP